VRGDRRASWRSSPLSVCPEPVGAEGGRSPTTTPPPFPSKPKAAISPKMAFYTYMLLCADGKYYIGHTEDLELRIAQHQSGHFGGYTLRRRPVELVWSDSFLSRYEALSAERQIKGWSRAKKEALVAGDWERISELARNRIKREGGEGEGS
jgi:putative endonuclease